jgi:hypothetical protein
MPALKPTAVVGRIDWLGFVPDRDAALASVARSSMGATFAGPEGEAHGGLTRPSCSRVAAQHPRGTEIRNARQFSILSAEELGRIADALGLARLDPAWLGATVVLAGIPDLSHLPPSSRLQDEVSGATLVVDMQNRPCHLPAPVIEAAAPGHGAGFKRAARGLRGVTAWTEREGMLSIGDPVRLHVPDQRAWRGLSRADPPGAAVEPASGASAGPSRSG